MGAQAIRLKMQSESSSAQTQGWISRDQHTENAKMNLRDESCHNAVLLLQHRGLKNSVLI